MALWCGLPVELSGALSVAARRHGVVLASGPNFAPAGGLDRWMRLPYTVPEHQLLEVGPRLAAAWSEALRFEERVPRRRARIVA